MGKEETKKISRRDLLRTGIAGIAGLAVGAVVGYSSYPLINPPAPVSTMPTEPIMKRKVRGETPAERAVNAAKEFIETYNVPPDFKIKVLLPAPNEASFMAVSAKWKALTGIDVQSIAVAYPEMYEKIMAEAAVKSGAYDVLCMKPFWLGDFVNAGVIACITDWVREYDPRIHGQPDGIIYPLDWGMCCLGKEYYAIAVDADINLAFWRKDLFTDPKEQEKFEKQYGYPLRIPLTIKEYMDVAEFFYRPPELYGVAEHSMVTDVWHGFLWRLACQKWPVFYPFDDDANCMLDTPEGYAAAESYMHARKYSHPDILAWGVGEIYDAYAKGKVAGGVEFPSLQKTISDPNVSVVVDKIMYGPVPGKLVDTPYGKKIISFSVNGGSWVVAVNAYSKYPELAYLYCQFFTDPENIIEAVLVRGSWLDIHRYNMVGSSPDPHILKVYGSLEFLEKFADYADAAVPPLMIPGANEYHDKLGRNMHEAIKNNLSAEEVMRKTAKDWDEITNRLGKEVVAKYWRAVKTLWPRPKILA
jgi:multiple sugar transport system substrate-binding protein